MINGMATWMLMGEATPREIPEERLLLPMDEEAFRAFYDRTARPLWAYLSRMTRDAELAEDILQETYYRFCRAGATHESEDHRRNSLFHIATNVLRDHVRKQRFLQVPLEESSAEVLADGTDERIDIGRALAELEPKQRQIVWLAYAQGASHAEIAAICGVREKSVRTILFRARRKMAALLGRAKGGQA